MLDNLQWGEADVPLFETKSKTRMISAHKSYSSKIRHSSCFCGEQYGTVKKRRRNRRSHQKPQFPAEILFAFFHQIRQFSII